MILRLILAVVVAFAGGSAAHAQSPTVKLDVESARAVLAAVGDPALTRDRALAVARLPGNQGLIRKTRSYGRPADDALLAAAHHQASAADRDFHFAAVRDGAGKIAAALAQLTDSPTALDEVKRRIARFTPSGLVGPVTGYVILGGDSGGFSFDGPEFFLDLAHFPSPALARTILAHELYHAVQNAAAAARPASASASACLAAIPSAKTLGDLFDSLSQEGAASYVGDVLALKDEPDPAAKAEYERAAAGVRRVATSRTLLQLSVIGLTADPPVPYDDIYALAFYGHEILYSLGYVMTRAIAREEGDGAVARLAGRRGAAFVTAYAELKGYGGSEAPALDAATVAWARRLAACDRR